MGCSSTLDSVLAQDLYSALTEKGYRVFFSRITLQSKLGEAYEPYIFAALNSAKVMLVIGTDPEYYSAVWVKNEWSRYLKICAGDNSKHLIPCYKDMDAYDMPREFRPLQGVDLGKMGAVQDILFNMEKYIPLKKQNTTVIQEKVVVGGTGGSNKIASLLDRGNMALEDGDWAKADSFFEDVLNNDSKNAQAYIGKTLAQERCRTMDALVRKRRDVYQNVSSEKRYIQEKSAHISEMVERYSLTNYVGQGSIRNLYQFDLSYSSEVSGRQKQYREEESWWQNHKLLSRAEKFAVGAVAEHLQNEKKHLFSQLADRVKKAQEADARSAAKLEAAYDAHIAEADKQAEKLYNDGLARREKDYENWLEQAKKETSPDKLKKLADNFISLREYKDSKDLAEHCCKRAAEEQAKIDAERERQRVIAEQKRKAHQKRNKTIAKLATACVVLAIAAALVVTKVIIPGNAYKEAVSLMENGQYEEAIVAFEALEGFRDAKEMATSVKEIQKEEENARIAAEKKAEEERLAAEKKAEEERLAAEYSKAEALFDSGKFDDAHAVFQTLGNYRDSVNKLKEIRYAQGVQFMTDENYKQAVEVFTKLGNYSDSVEKLKEAENGVLKTVEKGDTVIFGHYNNSALNWTVMSRKDNTIVLFCDKMIDAQSFDKDNKSSWTSSRMYTVLHNIYSMWFSEDELDMIQKTPNGKIYPPSKQELEDLFGITLSEGTNCDDMKTDTYRNNSYFGKWWWTRTAERPYPGGGVFLMTVSKAGQVQHRSATDFGCIRPVITIKVP